MICLVYSDQPAQKPLTSMSLNQAELSFLRPENLVTASEGDMDEAALATLYRVHEFPRDRRGRRQGVGNVQYIRYGSCGSLTCLDQFNGAQGSGRKVLARSSVQQG